MEIPPPPVPAVWPRLPMVPFVNFGDKKNERNGELGINEKIVIKGGITGVGKWWGCVRVGGGLGVMHDSLDLLAAL